MTEAYHHLQQRRMSSRSFRATVGCDGCFAGRAHRPGSVFTSSVCRHSVSSPYFLVFGRDPVFPGWQRIPVAGRECVGGAVREAQLAAKEMNAGMKTDILIVGYVVHPFSGS
jgi:hypothetical protein